jgi:restriction system protein
LPSGQQSIIDNRVGWARTYLKKAGLLESPKRSFLKITKVGREALKKGPSEIDVKFLRQFPQFVEFRDIRRPKNDHEESIEVTRFIANTTRAFRIWLPKS